MGPHQMREELKCVLVVGYKYSEGVSLPLPLLVALEVTLSSSSLEDVGLQISFEFVHSKIKPIYDPLYLSIGMVSVSSFVAGNFKDKKIQKV